MIASTMTITPPTHFFEKYRQRLVRNIVGYLPILNSDGAIVAPKGRESFVLDGKRRPLLLYVSRQGGGRRLELGSEGGDTGHLGLVKALTGLCDGMAEGGARGHTLCEFAEVRMEEWGHADQVEISSRATVRSGSSMWNKADSVFSFILVVCSCACGSNSSIDHGRRSWEWTYGTSVFTRSLGLR